MSTLSFSSVSTSSHSNCCLSHPQLQALEECVAKLACSIASASSLACESMKHLVGREESGMTSAWKSGSVDKPARRRRLKLDRSALLLCRRFSLTTAAVSRFLTLRYTVFRLFTQFPAVCTVVLVFSVVFSSSYCSCIICVADLSTAC